MKTRSPNPAEGFAPHRPRHLKGALTRFVRRHETAWDLVMGVLTVLYVALAFSEDSAGSLESYGIGALAALFLLEFSARCYDSIDRWAYLRSHWLDLITAVPVPGIPGLRALRLLRLLRLARIGVLIRHGLVAKGWDEFAIIWPTLVLFWVGSALALWLVEHDAPGTSITNFADAMKAAFLTAATLGFGRHTLPVTDDGQIIAALIVFFALGLWGYASSSLTRVWLNARQDSSAAVLEDMRREIQALREQLAPRGQSGLTTTVRDAIQPAGADDSLSLVSPTSTYEL
jgi:voltage-gated potassium channel